MEKHVTKYMITTDTSSVEAIEATKQVTSYINQGSVQENLLQLIQTLGEYLTNDDGFIRAKATGLLSASLMECRQEDINESAVSVLVDFYCDRLSDKTCVQHLLDGLFALSGYSHFTSSNAVSVIKRIIEHVDVQTFPQSTRNAAYRVVDRLIEKHAGALRSINNEFIFGFTRILDGEKDPRNLMLAFKIVKDIVDRFDISTHVEDIFEVTFCYFPITFKPPPDDPYGITAEDLKVSLRHCLASTPHFAKFAVPLILEKLSSTSGSAKKDSMETLAACAPVYGAASLLPHTHEIFRSLKLEVYHATDNSLEDAAIVAIQSVVGALSTGLSNQDGEPTERALKPLIDDCIGTLKDPDMKDSKQTGRILRAAASASDPACQYIVDIVVPLVLKQIRETNVAVLKKANLDILIDLLEASKTLYGVADESGSVDQDFVSPLIQHKERFFGIFESCLTASNEYNLLRLSGLNGIKLMVLSKEYLTPNEIGLAVQSFNKILLDPVEDGELRKAALDALCATSHINSLYIIEQTLPALMAKLPEDQEVAQQDSYVLTALKSICPTESVYIHAAPLLLQKLDAICQQGKTQVEYAQAIASVLLNILQTKAAESHADLAKEIHTMVPYIFRKVIEASLDTSDSLYLDPQLLQTLSLIVITILIKADSSEQRVFMDMIFKSFVQGDLVEFMHTQGQFKPLDPTAPEGQQRTVQLFSAAICSLRKDVALPVSSMEDFLNTMVTLALSSDIQTTSVSRMIGSLINKWKDNNALTEYVKTTSLLLQDTTTQNPRALEVYLWITKALILRAHPLCYELTDKVIEWCGLSIQGVAHGFDILVGDDVYALNKSLFATVTLLYKQRFFSYSLPKLIQGYHSAQPDIKPNYLIALSFLLKNVPKQILLNELPPLIPLLIQSLELPDTALRVSTLNTFKLAVTEAPETISSQVSMILPSLLGILQDRSSSIQVRVAVLNCLSEFPTSLPKDVLKPHAQSVLWKLKVALDDRKRIVRKEAVDCRSKWFVIL